MAIFKKKTHIMHKFWKPYLKQEHVVRSKGVNRMLRSIKGRCHFFIWYKSIEK